MISYQSALQIIAEAVQPLPPVSRPPQSVPGQALASAVAAACDVPPFANAAMDGFALRATETREANAAHPVSLRIAGTIPAGVPPPAATPAGCAWEIMTGAAMPADCDAVVPVEKAEALRTSAGTAEVLIRQPAETGDNRRKAGEDFVRGQAVLPAHAIVTPQAIMGLAATGCDAVAVRPLPRIAVIATGNELTFDGTPGARGLIRDANGPYLASALRHLGLPLVMHRSVRDEPDDLARALAAAHERADLILTTGGVSAGRLDFVPATVSGSGGEVLFHKVAIRPGKPLLFARWANGPHLFGLPGNPMAVAVGMRFFVMAALRALQGLPAERCPLARCHGAIRKRANLTFFAKALATVDGAARLQVEVLPGQESFRIAPLLRANCWAVIPEGREDVAAGDLVPIAPLFPGAFPEPAA